MKLQKIEIEYHKLISILRDEKSPRISLLYLNNFLSRLLPLDDNLILESYFIEFIAKYIKLLSDFNITGIFPEQLAIILYNSKRLLTIDIFKDYHHELALAINEFEKKLTSLKEVLKGIKNSDLLENKTGIPFPVIEKHLFNGKLFGKIEYVNIHLRKTNKLNNDIILVIPSQEKLEKQIHNQILISWKVAKAFCSKKIKRFSPSHELIISFSEKYGNYVGESLGVALTLGFIQQLHTLYNLPVTVSINNSVCFTGGLDEDGNVKSVSSEIIKQKVETVFYSCKTIFAIPKADEKAAKEKLDQLKKDYPERKLKLIAIDDLDDILNRRNLVNLDKLNVFSRSLKILKSREVTAILSIILFGIIFYNALKYFDNNPVNFVKKDDILKIENKFGSVLFEKKINNILLLDFRKTRKLIDINNDGINEVILCSEYLKGTIEESKTGRIACFNNNGELIWEYLLDTKISTPEENFPTQFIIRLIFDIVKEDDLNVIYVVAQNIVYYPNVIFRLDARTGKRLPGMFLHSGGINNGIISDFNRDGKPELIAVGVNNGYERAVIFSVDLSELKKEQRSPALLSYSFIGYKVARFNKYILIPKTDYNSHQHLRYNNSMVVRLNPSDRNIYFTTLEGKYPNDFSGIGYSIDRSLMRPKVIIGDKFQVRRDSLVAQGKLNSPFTNTKEYEKILLNQFAKWDSTSGRFVKLITE